MAQISPKADVELNALSRIIGQAEETIKLGTEAKDTSWDKVFDLMAEFDQPYFLADDGYTLVRQKRQGSPKLDEGELYMQLLLRFPKSKVDKIWNAITDQKVNSVKLEAAVQNGVVPPDVLDKAISEPDPTYARVRSKWSKQDEERARIFGIEKKETV